MEAQTKQGQGVPLYEIIQLEQGSQSWLDYRRSKITATDVSVLMGLNPFKTPYRLYQEKMGLVEPEPENDKMREGKILEDLARAYFNEVIMDDFKPIVVVNDWKMASLDGMNSRGEILEVKCGKKSHEQALNKEIAPYYYAQLQWQLHLSGENQVWYLSYRSIQDRIFWRVDRDNAFIEKMIVEAKEFFRRLMEFDPPPLCDRDYVKKDDKDWRMIAHLYNESSRELDICKARNEALRQELIKMSGGQSCRGGGVILTLSTRRGNVDYGSIEALKSIDLDKYRKSSSEVYTIREDKNGI